MLLCLRPGVVCASIHAHTGLTSTLHFTSGQKKKKKRAGYIARIKEAQLVVITATSFFPSSSSSYYYFIASAELQRRVDVTRKQATNARRVKDK